MFTKRSECSNCGHAPVCRYKGRYREFLNEVQRATERGGLVEDKDTFLTVVDCRQWIPIKRKEE